MSAPCDSTVVPCMDSRPELNNRATGSHAKRTEGSGAVVPSSRVTLSFATRRVSCGTSQWRPPRIRRGGPDSSHCRLVVCGAVGPALCRLPALLPASRRVGRALALLFSDFAIGQHQHQQPRPGQLLWGRRLRRADTSRHSRVAPAAAARLPGLPAASRGGRRCLCPLLCHARPANPTLCSARAGCLVRGVAWPRGRGPLLLATPPACNRKTASRHVMG